MTKEAAVAYCPEDGLAHCFRTVNGVPITNPMCGKKLGPVRENPDNHKQANMCGECLPLFLAHLQVDETRFKKAVKK